MTMKHEDSREWVLLLCWAVLVMVVLLVCGHLGNRLSEIRSSFRDPSPPAQPSGSVGNGEDRP